MARAKALKTEVIPRPEGKGKAHGKRVIITAQSAADQRKQGICKNYKAAPWLHRGRAACFPQESARKKRSDKQ